MLPNTPLPNEESMAALAMGFCIAFLFSIIKVMVSPMKRTFGSIFTEIFISLVVGFTVGMIGADLEWGNWLIALSAAIATLTADKLVLSVIGLGEAYPDLLKRGLTNWIDRKTK